MPYYAFGQVIFAFIIIFGTYMF